MEKEFESATKLSLWFVLMSIGAGMFVCAVLLWRKMLMTQLFGVKPRCVTGRRKISKLGDESHRNKCVCVSDYVNLGLRKIVSSRISVSC
jgi:hypothetical protein